MISRPDIRSNMVILLNRYYRSSIHCLRGCDHGFANLKMVGTILANGGLLASTKKAYIRNNDGGGRTVQRIHMVLQMMSERCGGQNEFELTLMTRMMFFWLTFEEPFQLCKQLQTKRRTYKGHYKNHVKFIKL